MKTKLSKEELWQINNNLTNRIKGTVDFIKPFGKVADIGIDNPMKHAIEEYFGIVINSLNWDFNKHTQYGRKYDVILCLEVLEHLFNPLLHLEDLRGLLKENGILYVSTPYQYPQWIKGRYHYHEIPTDRLMWLFDEAGYNVTRKDKITIAGNWYNHISGIRPFLRYFQKTRIYELQKQN